MPKGLMIVLLGTDGSGKTTIIRNIPQYLKSRGIEMNIYYYHWRPEFIIRNRKMMPGSKVQNPHSKSPYGKIKSFTKFMVINLDYFFGYWFKVKPQINEGGLVVFDRYYYDYYLDKLRYRLNISDFMLKVFQFMIPKPDMTFLLIGTPEVIYDRKKEIPISEIKDQIESIKKYKDSFNPSQYVNVDDSISKVVNEIGTFILNQK